MNRQHRLFLASLLAAAAVLSSTAAAQAVCPLPELASGLLLPLGITQSNQGNLIVGESGTAVPNSGRISIVGVDGSRRTLLDGLPSGLNDILEPSGPAGVFMRGRTLYVVIGIGDSIFPGPAPRTAAANPNPSSPLFSSVLAVHISAEVEKTTAGFTLTPADQQALAAGEKVTLGDGNHSLTIEMVANMENYVPVPVPAFPANVRGSNPYDLVVVEDQVYVTDGGRNHLWQIDIPSGTFAVLTAFANVPNPIAPFGPPFLEAVPTGIAYSSVNDQLLVALFRGFPFPAGTSVVQQVDRLTGAQAPLIAGLKTAIDVVPISTDAGSVHFVLQHTSGAPGPPALSGPGSLSLYETPAGPAAALASCLLRPTSMARDKKSGAFYITELGGRIVLVP